MALLSPGNQEPNITSRDKDSILNKSPHSSPDHVENAATAVIVVDKDTVFNSTTARVEGHGLIRQTLEDISSIMLIDDGPNRGSLLHCPAAASIDAHLSSQFLVSVPLQVDSSQR